MTTPVGTALTPAAAPLEGAPVVDGAAPVAEAAAPVEGVAPEAATDVKTDAAPVEAKPLALADLKFAEGFKADEKALEAFLPVANELGLKAEHVAKLVEHVAKADAVKAQAEQAAIEKQQAEWAAQLAPMKADLPLAIRAFNKFGTPELRAMLDNSGFGNFPPLVAAFAAIGKAMAEDSISGATSGTNGALSHAEQEQQAYRERYPTMFTNGNR